MAALTFDEALDRCLDMLRAGLAVEQCLTYYPVYASELRPQLEAGHALLSGQPKIAPESPAQARGRERLLDAAAQQRAQPAPEPAPALLPLWLSGWKRRLTALPPAAVLAVGLLLLGGAAVGVSAATGQGPVGSLLTAGSQSHDDKLVGTVTARDCTAGTLTINQTLVQITPDTDLHGLTCEQIALGMKLKVRTDDGDPGQPLVATDVQLAGDDQADDDSQGDCPTDATPTPTTGGTSGGCEDNDDAACPTDAAATPQSEGENDGDCDDGEDVGDSTPCPDALGQCDTNDATPGPTEVDERGDANDGDHEDADDQGNDEDTGEHDGSDGTPGDIHDQGDDTDDGHHAGTPRPTEASNDNEDDGSDQEGDGHGHANGEEDANHGDQSSDDNPDGGSSPTDGGD